MIEERYGRQWDIIDTERLHSLPIKIIGTGSVGSFTCLSLAKMGARMLEVWDNDMIDEVNISNQFFRLGDIGEFKVDALQSLISDFEDVPIMTNPVKCKGNESNLNGVIITALDSMRSRKKIWDSIKNNDDVELFIDPRMGGRVARIYSVNPKTGVDEYEQTLYDDDESAEERCTERTILYNVLGISSLICKAIEDYMKDGQEGCSETILDYATYTLIHNKNM